MEQKTLLDYLNSQLEHERVLAVSDLIFQTDDYIRAIAAAITGLTLKVVDDDVAVRQFLAVRRMADEVSAWLSAHHQILCQHVGAQALATPAVTTEAQDDPAQREQTTLH